MHDDADINRIWDNFMGDTTSFAVLRAMAAMLLFTFSGSRLSRTIDR
ncbi:MAG: hypothetical protein JWM58_1213 [Rhizobium sp.]|nr:hypothetical protein [Rhizobium sp.]